MEQQAIQEQDKIVNGVNVTELFGSIDAIKETTSLGTFKFRSKNKWLGGPLNRSTIQNFYGVGEEQSREVEPIVETIDKCLEMVGPVKKGKAANEPEDVTKFRSRLEEMQSFLQSFGTIVDMMVTLGPEGLERVSGMMTKMI